jgi:pseudaminic acid synthase
MTELALGKKDYKLTNSQLKSKKYSRSLYIVKDVIKGEIVSIENVRSIRPGYGLHPKFYTKVLGKKFIDSFEKGTRLKLEYIDHNF